MAQKCKNYLVATAVIDNSFTELDPSPTLGLLVLEDVLKMKAGCLGEGRVVSLLNIRTTADIVGLSTAPSCTHKSPICMHLNTS